MRHSDSDLWAVLFILISYDQSEEQSRELDVSFGAIGIKRDIETESPVSRSS